MFICIVGMIEKNSIQGCLDYFNTLSVHLKQESDKFESSHQLTQASGKRKIRKRRIRTQHSAVPEIHKLKPTRHLSLIDKQTRQPVKSPLITPSTPVRSKSFSQGRMQPQQLKCSSTISSQFGDREIRQFIKWVVWYLFLFMADFQGIACPQYIITFKCW